MATSTAELPRAIDYPYAPPLERWVFIETGEPPAFAVENRMPVLALGSNASPLQLLSKFGGRAGHIPVSRAVLHDHVVVYSAHFTRYGALPATLHHHPGSACLVGVTWLDAAQLARMHETESLGVNYDYIERDDLILEHDGEPLEAPLVGLYTSRYGPLLHGGMSVRLAEVASSGCPLPALTQPAALRMAQRRVAPGMSFDDFMTRIVEDPGFRAACSRRLTLA